jgi:hypothetical protein
VGNSELFVVTMSVLTGNITLTAVELGNASMLSGMDLPNCDRSMGIVPIEGNISNVLMFMGMDVAVTPLTFPLVTTVCGGEEGGSCFGLLNRLANIGACDGFSNGEWDDEEVGDVTPKFNGVALLLEEFNGVFLFDAVFRFFFAGASVLSQDVMMGACVAPFSNAAGESDTKSVGSLGSMLVGSTAVMDSGKGSASNSGISSMVRTGGFSSSIPFTENVKHNRRGLVRRHENM